MRFLGVDFGWRSQPSGVAVFQPGSPVETGCADTPDDVLSWIDRTVGDQPAIVAVDAPLLIPNETGMRAPDRLMHVHFGRYHAGCYPANRRLPFADRVISFSRALEQRGFRHADTIVAGEPGRFQIEVYPHAAAIQLFNLNRILKYKKGPLASRLVEMKRYRRLLVRLLGRGLPAIPTAGGRAIKQVEDRLDAALCAYIGWRWWTYGSAASEVFGDGESGYIVAPRRAS